MQAKFEFGFGQLIFHRVTPVDLCIFGLEKTNESQICTLLHLQIIKKRYGEFFFKTD